MTGPDRKVIAALDRRSGLDVSGLQRATRLGLATLDVTLQKLRRMGMIDADGDGYRLRAPGMRVAREIRTATIR